MPSPLLVVDVVVHLPMICDFSDAAGAGHAGQLCELAGLGERRPAAGAGDRWHPPFRAGPGPYLASARPRPGQFRAGGDQEALRLLMIDSRQPPAR